MPKPKVKVPLQFANPEKSGVEVDVPEEGLADFKIELK